MEITRTEQTNLAKLVYYALHPMGIFALTPLIISYMVTSSVMNVLWWMVALLAVFMLPTYLLFKWLLPRLERDQLVMAVSALGAVLMLACLLLAYQFNAPEGMTACIWAGLVGGVASLVAPLLKIELSLHALMLAGCAMTCIVSSTVAGLVVFALCLASNWAVIELKHSTLPQTVLSWCVMSLAVLLSFSLFA